MVLYLSQYIQDWAAGTAWADWLSWLRVFRYISVRSAGAAVTALALSWWLGPPLIAWLRNIRLRQEYRDKAEEGGVAHQAQKSGTPTMGGVLIVLVIDLAALLWAQWNLLIVLTLVSLFVLALLGAYDDWKKITQRRGEGAKEHVKLIVQFGLALFIGCYMLLHPQMRRLVSDVMVPFCKYPILTGTAGAVVGLGLVLFTIVGSSNAVNLTDGLDGLAIGCTVIVSFVFLVMTYLAGHALWAKYLQIDHVPGASELTVLCAGMIGAGLGFLWFNAHPAQVFMGDTGSLALGGVLGIMAVLIHQPFVLFIAGGVFVAEAVSVMLQRSWFKYTRAKYGEGQRVFLMAPIHHHFQKKGWAETQVVMRFYILCLLCAVVALATLKLR
ncbi:MAG TPA: phospho-N-acetylmuramoyl-pentapeptide-transferase [Verrucomicrobiae bacterium]|jgi:phospho-N-acetylmuramoyl-pentapeptide-transferase